MSESFQPNGDDSAQETRARLQAQFARRRDLTTAGTQALLAAALRYRAWQSALGRTNREFDAFLERVLRNPKSLAPSDYARAYEALRAQASKAGPGSQPAGSSRQAFGFATQTNAARATLALLQRQQAAIARQIAVLQKQGSARSIFELGLLYDRLARVSKQIGEIGARLKAPVVTPPEVRRAVQEGALSAKLRAAQADVKTLVLMAEGLKQELARGPLLQRKAQQLAFVLARLRLLSIRGVRVGPHVVTLAMLDKTLAERTTRLLGSRFGGSAGASRAPLIVRPA